MAQREDFQNFDMFLEFRTIEAMVKLYCHNHHKTSGEVLCHDCNEILDYAKTRTLRCPHFKNKIPCSKCKIHCYQEPFKGRIREIMKYSGPRMTFRHPLLALRHLLSFLRKT